MVPTDLFAYIPRNQSLAGQPLLVACPSAYISWLHTSCWLSHLAKSPTYPITYNSCRNDSTIAKLKILPQYANDNLPRCIYYCLPFSPCFLPRLILIQIVILFFIWLLFSGKGCFFMTRSMTSWELAGDVNAGLQED